MEVEDDRGKKFPSDKKFLSIEYPGNVVNIDNAVRTLGGIEELSRVSHNYFFFSPHLIDT